MSYLDAARHVMIEANVSQSVLALLYIGTIVRMHLAGRINYILIVSTLLLISCFTYQVETILQYKLIQNKYRADSGDAFGCSNLAQTDRQCYKLCVTQAFFLWLNQVSYNGGIWLFSSKIWAIAVSLQFSHEGRVPGDLKAKLNRLPLAGIAVIVILATIFTITGFYGKIPRTIFIVACLEWFVNYGFFIDALRRMKGDIKHLPHT
jgi:hypothetical protein